MGKLRRFNKYSTNGDITIIHITNRKGEEFEVLVDTEDLGRLINADLSWYTIWKRDIGSYYARATIYKGKIDEEYKYSTVSLHQFIMNPAKGECVDHINHNTLDNRKENLRLVCDSKNTRNRKGRNSNNTSGYRNVSKIGKNWVVQLQVDGKNTVLGKFDDVDEAGKFAKDMRELHYGEFAGKC